MCIFRRSLYEQEGGGHLQLSKTAAQPEQQAESAPSLRRSLPTKISKRGRTKLAQVVETHTCNFVPTTESL
jgi:hypothetical protein